jgi:hypothetical protein
MHLSGRLMPPEQYRTIAGLSITARHDTTGHHTCCFRPVSAWLCSALDSPAKTGWKLPPSRCSQQRCTGGSLPPSTTHGWLHTYSRHKQPHNKTSRLCELSQRCSTNMEMAPPALISCSQTAVNPGYSITGQEGVPTLSACVFT